MLRAPFGYPEHLWCRWWDSLHLRPWLKLLLQPVFELVAAAVHRTAAFQFRVPLLHMNKTDTLWVSVLFMVPVVGLEPTRYRYQRILSPSRLPFHHTGVSPCDYRPFQGKMQVLFVSLVLFLPECAQTGAWTGLPERRPCFRPESARPQGLPDIWGRNSRWPECLRQ